MDITGSTEIFVKDLLYAFRRFVRNPGFSAVVVLSLALGIGANTVIFTLMDAVLLRNLPVRNPAELVMLTNPNKSGGWLGLAGNDRNWISYPEFIELRENLTTLSGLCAASASLDDYRVRIAGGEQEQVRGRLVSEEYFSLLGVEPAIGRFFNSRDATGPRQDPYVVISHDFWQRRFGGKTDVLDTLIKLNDATLTVIGVAAPGFKGESVGQNPDIWIPMLMQPAVFPGRDWLHESPSQSLEKMMWLHGIGRLKPGASLASVQAEATVVFEGMLRAFYPSTLPRDVEEEAFSQHLIVRDARTGVFPGRDEVASQLKILLAVAGLVLLIACANVANLLLTRATTRRREVAVRLSIGASRSRLFRQFLTESLLYSVVGGAAGLLIALASAPILVRVLSDPSRPLDLRAGLDWRVLAFTAGITLSTCVLFGVAPALRASRTNINLTLRETGAGSTNSGRRVNLAKVLVIGQVALSLLLVVGAGLFLRTLWNLQNISLGYPKEELLQVRVDGVTAGYKKQALTDFYSDLGERLRVLPGVRGVAYSSLGLLTGRESQTRIEADGFVPQRDEDREAYDDLISPGYFAVLGIPVLLGRDIELQDTNGSQKLCVINEELAGRFFAGQNPIGRHITEFVEEDESETFEIVGVVKNVRSRSALREQIPQTFYKALTPGFRGSVVFEIRTAGEPKSMLAAVRRTILGANPDVPITASYTIEDLIARRTLAEGQIAYLCVIFGILALFLAATGLYGVLSEGVARRTNEIGIRMALGASRGKVVAMVLGETGLLVAIGLVAGVIAAGLSTQVIAAKLYGLSKMDPLTIVVALALLSIVGLAAGYVPAARAAKVDPVRALRE